MACEILFKTEHHAHATDYTHSDPVKDRRGVYKKGYPVIIKQVPHPGWGTKEGLPYFAKVVVTDGDMQDVEDMILTNFSTSSLNASWVRNIDWAVVTQVASIDGYRLRVYTTNPGFSNLAGLTRTMVENYLNNWNAVVFSTATNEVVFDAAIFEDDRTVVIPGTLQSEGFWGFNTSQIVFSETTYVEGTGDHTVTADYSALQGYIDDPDNMEGRARVIVEEKGGTVISNTNGSIQFSIHRSDVLDVFKRDLKERLENTIYRRQLRIHETTIDNIVSQGGSVDLTLAQLQAYIINRLDEDL